MLWLPPNTIKGVYLMSSVIVEVLIIAFVDENMSKTFTRRSRQVTLTNGSFTKNM